jgi:hypothetical protein
MDVIFSNLFGIGSGKGENRVTSTPDFAAASAVYKPAPPADE